MANSRLQKEVEKERKQEQVKKSRLQKEVDKERERNGLPAQKTALTRLQKEVEKERAAGVSSPNRGGSVWPGYTLNTTPQKDTTTTQPKTSYLDSARNAAQASIATGTGTLSDIDRESRRKELQAELDDLNSQASLNRKKMVGYQRGNVGNLLKEAERESVEIANRISEVNKQLEWLDKPESISYSDQLSDELAAAQERQRQAQSAVSKYSGSAGGRALAALSAEEREALYQDLNDANAAVASLSREQDQIDYLNEYQDKVYDDTFTGQFGANYRQGRIAQDTNAAFAEYIANPTEANKNYAYALQELESQFQTNNQNALDDEGVVASWITKSAAGYIPQLVDQSKAYAAGGVLGGLAGALVGQPVMGAKVGITAASGVQSYNQMKGAAYRALIAEGMDESDALAAAQDEAFISALIEMGDTAFTLLTLGGGKALNILGNAAIKSGSKNVIVKGIAGAFGKGAANKAAKEAAEWAGKTGLQKALSVGTGIALNAGQEYAEEWSQEMVSSANKERESTGKWDLVKETAGLSKDALTGKNDEALSRAHEAGTEGFKIGLMFGGTMGTFNAAVSSWANAKTTAQQEQVVDEIMQDRELVESLIDGSMEMGAGTVSEKLAVEMRDKLANNEGVSRTEVAQLLAANEAYVQAGGMDNVEQSIEQAAREAVGLETSDASAPQDVLDVLERDDTQPHPEEVAIKTAQNAKQSVPYNAMSMGNPERSAHVQRQESAKKILGYGNEGVKLFNELADTGNVDAFELLTRFDDTYQAGLTGAKVELTNNFQREVYNAGRMDGIALEAKRKPGAILSKSESGFDFTGAPKSITQEQKTFADFFAKKMGVKGFWDGQDGNAKYNAYYNSSTGGVAFAQDFGIDPELMKKLGSADFMEKVERLESKRENSFVFYLAHEIADHVATNRAPAEMRAFNNAMYNYKQKKAGGENLARSKQMFYGSRGVALTTEGAIEEVGADSILDLYDGDEKAFMEAMVRIANGTDEQAKKGARTFRDILTDIIKKLKAWAGKLTGRENAGAKANVENGITELERLRDLFEQGIAASMKAVEAARATKQTADMKSGDKAGVAYDAETESAYPTMLSLKTWTESEYVRARKQAAAEIAKALGISEKQALDYIDSVNSIAKMIADDRVRLDYEASPGRSSFVSNAEYGGSVDFSTICKKRRLFTGTFEAIQEALPNTALTAEEILEIRSMMDKKGYEVSCGLCYVEGSRANMGQYTKQFIERYKATNPEYVPNMAEMNTATGQEKIRREHPEVYEAYEYFMNHYGRLKPTDKALFASQQKPKMYQMATEYKGEILNKFGKRGNVEQKNANGGLRLQSFSDFEIIHLIDSMQVIMDMSRVGLAGQAYTKVPDFAWALGGTGLKINLSLIAKGVDRKGNLILDEKEGMSAADAMALREQYSENVGTIIVVFTDRQMKAAMADPRIDYIIPFHRSQWKTDQYEVMGLPANAKDYTPWQNEAYINPVYNEKGKKLRPDNYMPNTYWDFSKSGKENAEAYLKMCAENNRRPKFHYLLKDNGNGSYSMQKDGSTDGYWKLLIDFKMYDNDGNGVPQRPVRPDFNMEQAQRMLNEYTGGHSKFPAAKDVVDEFVKKFKQSEAEKSANNAGRAEDDRDTMSYSMKGGAENDGDEGVADYGGKPADPVRSDSGGSRMGGKLDRAGKADADRQSESDNRRAFRDLIQNVPEFAELIGAKVKGRTVTRSDMQKAIREITARDAESAKEASAARMRATYARSLSTMSEQRLDRVYADYCYPGFQDKTQAYLVYIEPLDFLSLTNTSVQTFLEENPERLNEGENRQWGGPNNIYNLDKMYLRIDGGGNVVGHEGRHRMAALYREGVEKVAIPLVLADGPAENAKPIAVQHLFGQKDSGIMSYDSVYVHHALPVSKEYETINRYVFGSVSKDNPLAEPNIQFSLKGEKSMRKEIQRIREEGAKSGKSEAEIESDIMGVVGPEYGELIKTYGQIKRGERATREIEVPRKTEEDRHVSQTIRTVLEAEATPDAAVPTIQQLIAQGDFSYDVITDKAAMAAAERSIRTKGYETVLAGWISDVKDGKVSKANTAIGWALYNQAANANDLSTAMTILDYMVGHQRNAAQALQATRILKKMSPDAQLYSVVKSVQSLEESLNKGKTDSDETGETAAEEVGKAKKDAADAIKKASSKVKAKRKGNRVEIDSNMVGEPFVFEYAQKVGEAVAKGLEAKQKQKTKERTFLQQITAQVKRFAEEKMPKEQKGKSLTAIDLLRDYVQNQAFYADAWAYAQEELRMKYADDPVFDEFINTGIGVDSNFNPRNAIFMRALVMAAADSGEGKSVLRKQAALGFTGMAETIADNLIQQTGATGEMADTIRDAAHAYVYNALSEEGAADTQIVDAAIRSAMSDIGIKVSEIVASGTGDTAEQEIISKLVGKYGFGLTEATNTAEVVADRFDAMCREYSQRRLESMFKERSNVRKTIPEKIEQLGRLGAFDIGSAYNQKAAERIFKTGTTLTVNEDLARQFLRAKTQEERDAILADIYRDIGRQMPSTFIDKWNAWRYLAMLGNPRTHVRNVVGNLGFALPVAAKDMTATAIEKAVSFVSGGKIERTKGMPSRDLLKAAYDDYANVADQISGNGKYSDASMKNKYIEEGRVIFKNKVLEKARTGNSAALEKEDVWFARPHYAFALAQYCKAQGITADQLRSGKALGNARTYAIKEAQKATYRDANAFSDTISQLGRYQGDNVVKKGLSVVLEGILPFRKTPANILVRGLEYSPLGLIKSLALDLAKVKNGDIAAAEAIDNISAGLTGTGLMALGLWAAAEGLIRGAGGDDEEEKKFEELQGHQSYALELPDGTSVTLDWLAPEVLPMFVGVNLYEMAKDRKGEYKLADILTAVSNVTEPLLEMSCLQSLNDVFDSVGYASTEGLSALPSALASAATSYLTQAFPTILGQAERSSQDVRMTTYTEKNDFLTSNMQYTLGKISAKVPGWDYHQIPYIDAWGRAESTGTTGQNAANNFLNPAYMSQIETSAMEEELLRLYEVTGESAVLPSRAQKYFNVDGERKDLTAEEYVKYATEKGQLSYKVVTALTSSSAYKSMTDSERVEAIDMAYDYANAVAKTKVSTYKPDGWVAKAITTNKKTGLNPEKYIPLYMDQKDIESLKDSDGDTISNSKGLLIMQMIYNTKGLTSEQKQALFVDFGVGKTVIHYNSALVNQKLAEMRKK